MLSVVNLCVIQLSAILLGVIVMSAAILTVVPLGVIMLSVVAPLISMSLNEDIFSPFLTNVLFVAPVTKISHL
jgi:hypothetical protein